MCSNFFFFFLKDFIYFIFRQSGREGEREEEKHQCVVAFHTSPTRGLARYPGMCPDSESNQQPFGLQACAQSSEPYQPGLGKLSRHQLWGCLLPLVTKETVRSFHCLGPTGFNLSLVGSTLSSYQVHACTCMGFSEHTGWWDITLDRTCGKKKTREHLDSI